ncbi:MAG: cysteine hydrolase, partial [Chloroflexi bacterium]|nr:cysteine hydrolase [Chloroflexota bacterium]
EWVELYGDAALLERVARVQTAARRARVRLIHIRTALRSEYLERRLPLTQYQRRLVERGWAREGSPGAEVHPGVAPLPGETVLTKQHEGPFVGTDLEQVLRRLDAHYLLVAGIPTSAAVRNIGTDGNNRFFNVILISDCCQDQDPQVHRVLMSKVLKHQSQIATAAEVCAALAA